MRSMAKNGLMLLAPVYTRPGVAATQKPTDEQVGNALMLRQAPDKARDLAVLLSSSVTRGFGDDIATTP